MPSSNRFSIYSLVPWIVGVFPKLREVCRVWPGSSAWPVGRERLYGGRHTGIKRNKVSPKDPRTATEISSGGMSGGDRMHHHGYAAAYADHLRPFVRSNERITLVEVGILRGTGLAIWCDLFPHGRIIALDIDLDHYFANREHIKLYGGFGSNEPEVYEYDQLAPDATQLSKILNGD